MIENPEAMKKYQKYIDVLSFITDVDRDSNQIISAKGKQELADHYLWLQSEASDTIWDKNYISMKLVEAMHNDIIRE